MPKSCTEWSSSVAGHEACGFPGTEPAHGGHCISGKPSEILQRRGSVNPGSAANDDCSGLVHAERDVDQDHQGKPPEDGGHAQHGH